MTTISQAEYWNSEGGARWVRQQPILDALFTEHGLRALDASGVRDGDTVLDVGCGCGATTLMVAAKVGPRGLAVGVDVSAPMLSLARERAQAEGRSNVRFELGDVQVHPLGEGRYDAVVSRLGIMFFDEPAAAFARLRRALRPGGRFGAVCWRAPSENPWITLPMTAIAGLVQVAPVDPDAPGPFSLAPPGRARSLLESAGFVDVRVEALDLPLRFGGTSAEAASLLVEMGPAGRALSGVEQRVWRDAVGAIAAAVDPYTSAAGAILPGAAWLVTARGELSSR